MPDFGGDFGQVLILAENDRHIAFVFVNRAHHIQRDANIDPFFAPFVVGERTAVVAQFSGDDGNAIGAHRAKSRAPKSAHFRIGVEFGNAGVKPGR